MMVRSMHARCCAASTKRHIAQSRRGRQAANLQNGLLSTYLRVESGAADNLPAPATTIVSTKRKDEAETGTVMINVQESCM
jgi:hypothetical protein